MKSPTGVSTILSLPAYTTITCQTVSTNGQFLMSASDRGRVALFKVTDIISRNDNENGDIRKNRSSDAFFHFDAGSCLEKSIISSSPGCVNGLISTKDFLIAAISRPITHDAAIVAFNWKDLSQKRSNVAWAIEKSSGILPTDVNGLAIDRADERLFVGGGVGCGTAKDKDFGIRVIDLETRMEKTNPMLGHTAYVHAVSWSDPNSMAASAGEDGSARLWDIRQKRSCISTIEPHKRQDLSRPKLGPWLGDVGLAGDWLVTGGGPRPALWHMKSMAPTSIPQLPESCGSVYVASFVQNGDRIVLGGQFGGNKVYHVNMQGDLMAEVTTSSPCVYSIVASESETSHAIMATAGANSKIDLCTHNFSYRDNTITFPVL